jgi:glycosyltransferase involved in cell wall biosynthesis
VEQLRKNAGGSLRLINISESQKRASDGSDWSTVHNAVDTDIFNPSERPTGNYLAFLGRLTFNKGVDIAIRVAQATKSRLKIAGNISDEPAEKEFFESQIRCRLSDDIQWVGELDDLQKIAFLSNARALLMPIRWDEPFGIVVAEALACGTPVIATSRGSMPEIVRHGQTGYLAEDEDEMIHLVERLDQIDRRACRADAVERFSKDCLVAGHLEVIRSALAQDQS